jgi:hypothetical protein
MRFCKGMALMLVLASAAIAVGADEVKSGLEPGKRVSPFDVKAITGDNKGKTLCYV